MFGSRLEEFSPAARKLIMAVMCIPAVILCWFAFTVLKPVYFSALDTTLLPRSMTVAPSTPPQAEIIGTTRLASPAKAAKGAKGAKAEKRKAAGADTSSQVKKLPKSKGKNLQIGKETSIKLASDPTEVFGICGGAPPEFLPTVAFVDDCDTTKKAKKAEPAKKVVESETKVEKQVVAPPPKQVESSAESAVEQDPEVDEEGGVPEEPIADDADVEVDDTNTAEEGSSVLSSDAENASETEQEVQEEEEEEEEAIVADAGADEVEVNGTTQTRRNLLHRTVGYTMTGTGCNKKHWTKVYHENDGAGPNIKKNVKPAEEQLVKCLNNINHCNCETRKVAAQLDSIKSLPQKLKAIGKIGKGFKRYKTCAIVGNAGHLSLKKYGQYIDNHEFVVRFNVQPVQPYAEYVGSKTSLRVANHRRSLALCCRGNFPEGKAKQNGTGVMIWYPGSQSEIMNNCKRRFPKNPIMKMDLRQAKVLAGAVKDMRKTLYRLGVGPFGEWRQLTSGGHAIMFMASICDSISMYGITTYNAANRGGADHYGAALSEEKTRQSATTRARSGQKWHDWKGEKYVWRLLGAAGKVNICSM